MVFPNAPAERRKIKVDMAQRYDAGHVKLYVVLVDNGDRIPIPRKALPKSSKPTKTHPSQSTISSTTNFFYIIPRSQENLTGCVDFEHYDD